MAEVNDVVEMSREFQLGAVVSGYRDARSDKQKARDRKKRDIGERVMDRITDELTRNGWDYVHQNIRQISRSAANDCGVSTGPVAMLMSPFLTSLLLKFALQVAYWWLRRLVLTNRVIPDSNGAVVYHGGRRG